MSRPKGRPLPPEHRERIRQAMQKYRRPIPHGTYAGYNNRRCRCPECKAAGSAVNRAQYLARKAKKTREPS